MPQNIFLYNALTFIILIKQKDNEKGAAVSVVQQVPEQSTSSEKNDKKLKSVNSR